MSAEMRRERPRSVLKTFDSRDVETARAGLGRIYSAPASADRLEKRSPFLLRTRAAFLGRLTLASFEAANLHLTRESGNAVVLAFPVSGVMDYRKSGDRQTLVGQRQFVVARPFETFRIDSPQNHGMALNIPAEGLVARAERMTDKAFGATLLSRAVDRVDATGAVARTLAQRMKAAMAELAELDSVGMGALATGSYEDLLLDLAIPTLFPEIAEAMGMVAADCGSAVVRRARDYIHAHADEPIELARLAADLGVSMRALQENFKRRYGCSPRNYIQERRLDEARRRLTAPSPAASVTEIALDCGFGDLSQFSARYRETFGERPSDTLRAARVRLTGE